MVKLWTTLLCHLSPPRSLGTLGLSPQTYPGLGTCSAFWGHWSPEFKLLHPPLPQVSIHTLLGGLPGTTQPKSHFVHSLFLLLCHICQTWNDLAYCITPVGTWNDLAYCLFTCSVSLSPWECFLLEEVEFHQPYSLLCPQMGAHHQCSVSICQQIGKSRALRSDLRS